MGPEERPQETRQQVASGIRLTDSLGNDVDRGRRFPICIANNNASEHKRKGRCRDRADLGPREERRRKEPDRQEPEPAKPAAEPRPAHEEVNEESSGRRRACVVRGGWGDVAISYPPMQPQGPTRPGGFYASYRFRWRPDSPGATDPE
jgi:hypothetical protein